MKRNKRNLMIVGLTVGLVLILFAIAGYLFNPGRISPEQIVVAPPPSNLALDGTGFAVQPIKLGHSNIYFIKTSRGHILVDTGVKNLEEELDEVFRKAEVDPKSVLLIILTHGHMDHVGSIAYTKKITNAKVLVHQSYAEQLESGEIEPAIARNFTGSFLNFMTGLLGTTFEGVTPDILVEDELDLEEFGISGKIIHTPGHSSSSISIILDNGEALIGDLVREGEPGEVVMGNYCEDENALLESLEKVAVLESSAIYLSHGSHIGHHDLQNAIETIKEEFIQ